ncbi:hypothetical protein [Microcystis aeruginosa]|jgi:hypothetical protein|uniref:hypothetical protein n=1 Tax=Microcystis aeruginosa TaxID=1126 RepID=UPI0011EA7697|nr:hypothetical protein [Microcystis aeruginosa]TYT71010.1 hypothetical protein FXO09_12050 [Microcystis aeruginosa KLA2]
MFTQETDIFEQLAQQTGEMYPEIEPTAVEVEDTLPITTRETDIFEQLAQQTAEMSLETEDEAEEISPTNEGEAY